jgi:hypothetical protein
MGKPIDKHKPTKNLDELLDHLHKGGDDLDAFEQEALEGFATLENTQEAQQMKKRLDERMEEKLAEKRKPLFIYWSAAAGVALIIGLIFMMNSNKELSPDVGLADNTAVSEKQLEGDANNSLAPPAELKQEDLKSSGNTSGKGFAQGSSSGDQAAFKQGPMQKSAEEQNIASKTNESPVTLAETAKEPETDSDKKMEDSKRSDNSKLDDMVAGNKNQSQNNVPANAAAGSGSKDANGDLAKKSPAKEDVSTTKSAKDEEEAEPKATQYFTARKLKKEKEKSADRAETKPASEAEGTYEKSTIKSAELSIKETELTEKINKFFSDKDYKRSFVCTLTINSDDKVENIVFQNPELFHKGEQKEISDFFKKLKCFRNHEFAVYSTYQVNYKAQ